MALDPLSVAVGAGVALLCVGLYRRWMGRRDTATPQQPTVDAVCEPCDRPFPSMGEAIDHARDVHKAPDDEAARSLLEVSPE